MAIKRQTWIVSVILICAATRLLANDPIVRIDSAPEFFTATPFDVMPVSSITGASVACDDFLCDGCDAPSCVMACQPSQCRCSRVCCCPLWIVSAEAMYLRRSNARDQILATDQTTGATRLSTSDFNDDYDVIPRLQVIRQWSNCNGWDVNMFGISSFDSDVLTGSSPEYIAPGITLPSTAPGTVFRTRYETRFDSIELNYRRGSCRHRYLTLIAGFRWLELSDELDVDQTAPIQRDLFAIDTDNHMYGFQTGFDAVLWNRGPRFYVDSMLRAGIFYNRADQSTYAPVFTPAPPGLFVDRLSARASHTSFFGELGIHGVYRLTNRISIRAGYRLMWLEGVALAPNQIPVNSLIGPGTAALDTGGSLFLDGATLGASVTF